MPYLPEKKKALESRAEYMHMSTANLDDKTNVIGKFPATVTLPFYSLPTTLTLRDDSWLSVEAQS